MPLRLVDDNTLDDPFVTKLNAHGKLLWYYCMGNPGQQITGIFSATPAVIAARTCIPIEEVKELLQFFEKEGKVCWYQECNKIWTKNFAKRQIKSPKVTISAQHLLQKEPIIILKDFLDLYPANTAFWAEYGIDITNLQQRLNSKPNKEAK